MLELQVAELQNSHKSEISGSVEILESIHVRYLEEIKNLNTNLQRFTVERDAEVNKLKD